MGDEGVDVGRVEEGEPAGQVAGGLDAQDVFVVVGGDKGPGLGVVGSPWHPYAGEVGQDAGPGEPAVVLRVADEYGGAGRGSQNPGLADLPPDEGIDEGRLPCAGRPADDGEQGGFGVSQPGHEIVVELREELCPVGTRTRRPRERERKTRGGDTVAQRGECVEQLRPYVQGHHMRRMPNFGGFLKHMDVSARRCGPSGPWDGRDDWGAGITSAQHPGRETPKAVQDSYLPAIIRTASPNLHIVPRRRSSRDRDPGALSLVPARSRISPTSVPSHWPHTGPRSSVDRAGAF